MKTGRKRIDIETIKQRIFDKHGDVVTIVENTYENGRAHATFVDKDYGEWTARVSHVCAGMHHPQRSKDRDQSRVDVNEFERRCFEKHGDLFIKDGVYKNTYVEIKGHWNLKHAPYSKMKWEWFNETHPNSQLWMQNELISLGIIDKQRTYLSVLRSLN